jgi:hypothetical protein
MRTIEDLAALYAECIEAFRRDAPAEVWHHLERRMAERRRALDRHSAHDDDSRPTAPSSTACCAGALDRHSAHDDDSGALGQ